MPMDRLEELLRFDQRLCTGALAGLDEAGRGPLAGPVVAAAVIPDPAAFRCEELADLDDSKRLSAGRRESLRKAIIERAVAWSIGEASVEEIDNLNILHASRLAMMRALEALDSRADAVVVDGLSFEWEGRTLKGIVKGDSRSAAIASAGILAKVHRDELMVKLDGEWPEYGFARHKGYPTKAHREVLQRLGPLPVHRRSFGPVARLLT